MKRMSLVVGLALACVIILGSGKADARQIPSGGPDATRLVAVPNAAASGDAVTVWNANAGAAATAACIAPENNPLHESRIYAMMHVAIHDALNAIDRRSRPYAFDLPAKAGASPDAAVAAAARDVLVPLIGQLPLVPPDCIDRRHCKRRSRLYSGPRCIPDGQAKDRWYCSWTGCGGGDPRPESRRTARLDQFLIPTARKIPILASTNAPRVPRSSPLRYGKMSPPSF